VHWLSLLLRLRAVVHSTATLEEGKRSTFFTEYRESGFDNALVARELAEQWNISADEMVFADESVVHRRRVRKHSFCTSVKLNQ